MPTSIRQQSVASLPEHLQEAAMDETERASADFPEPLRLFRVRVERDEKEIAAYALLVRLFLQEIDKELAEKGRKR